MKASHVFKGVLLFSFFLQSSCSVFKIKKSSEENEQRKPSSVEVQLKYDSRRGSPAEYDPGAHPNSKWAQLFGETPNYRAIGLAALGGQEMTDEKFRWEFGPMWYRGRLTPESVKVFIVGQEGAQDENISNRAFTGSTGTRVQKFLNHLGIYRSYLFLNTFVYTINGQLEEDPKFKWIEQGEGSPIVEYRHKLFDNMLETNSQTVALFMGVGRGGKASLATWINARGGRCSTAWELKNCDTSGLVKWFQENRGVQIKNPILAIGVPHPGGANPNLGGDEQLENIKRGFTEAAQRVAQMKTQNTGWLQADKEERASLSDLIDRLNKPYVYKGYAPIPFRDFAFNTNWRMGSEGTTSNRWGASSIQVYSDAGEYNDKNSKFVRPRDQDSGLNKAKTALQGMNQRDVPYESPRYYSDTWSSDKPNYDFGPCGYYKPQDQPCELAEALVSWPNLKQMGVASVSHDSFGYFGTYRGRATNAKVYIIADQTSHDDFFSTRALSGTEGQKLQALLEKSGVGLNYFIQRSLPTDTLGVNSQDLIKAVTQPAFQEVYQKVFDAVKNKSDIKVVISIGPVAKAIVSQLQLNSDQTVIHIENMSQWKQATQAGQLIANRLGQTMTSDYKGELKTIPREDLPYHTRWWMGSSGDRAARGEDYSTGNYYRVWAPYWVSQLRPLNLSKEEAEQLKKIKVTP